MRRHVRLLVDMKGDELLGVRDFRKHVGWYLAGYPVGSATRRDMAQTSSLAELDTMIDALLERVGATLRCRRRTPGSHAATPRARDGSRCRPAGASRRSTRHRRRSEADVRSAVRQADAWAWRCA